ncbi:hypothetical protein BT63DRAFT_452377 [Microthyrium microscopicum]|uniref:Uncharacterized protein n=1 Tax=Microthyrium microscopicum TaxID=703497 RepID=A0A6A6UK67_9PEZI|nr:hypothetical protein BT63DRAFT_452377 [Microthyrium microscopicum]
MQTSTALVICRPKIGSRDKSRSLGPTSVPVVCSDPLDSKLPWPIYGDSQRPQAPLMMVIATGATLTAKITLKIFPLVEKDPNRAPDSRSFDCNEIPEIARPGSPELLKAKVHRIRAIAAMAYLLSLGPKLTWNGLIEGD